MTDPTSSLGNSAHNALDHAADKTTTALRPVMDMLVSGVHDAVERLAQVATDAAGKVEVSGDYVRQMQQQATRSTRTYVREKPLTALGVALAAGCVLGWVLRKR